MRIPEHVKDQIYQTADIVDVVSDYVQLKKKGQNYWGLSPFKAERTPSFSVHQAKGIYKDFASGKGGNMVGFLMELEGYTYTEALLHLARKYNIPVELEQGETTADTDARSSMAALNNWAAGWYHQQLLATDEGQTIGMAYFRERGFTQQTIEKFQLGYSPEAWDALTQAALKTQYQERYLLDTGLTLRSEKTGKLLDRFHGRVMFPILEVNGKVAGFGGRILKTDPKAAKYLNSPDSAVYNKSQLLYGLYYARQSIRSQDQAILVEGYTDVLSMHQAGLDTAVASCGTSLVEDQVKLLSRYTKNILIVYDADAAGQSATLRAIEIILAQGLTPKVLHLPDGQDPDSYLQQQGAAAFHRYAAESTQDFISFYLAGHLPDPRDTAAKAAAAEGLVQLIARIPDDLQRHLYLEEAARHLQLATDLLLNKTAQLRTHQRQQDQRREARQQQRTLQADPQEDAKTSVLPFESQEREILRLLLCYPDQWVKHEEQDTTVFELMSEMLREVQFDHPVLDQIRNHFFIYYPQRLERTIIAMMDELGQEAVPLITSLVTERYHLSESWKRIDINTPDNDSDLSLSVGQAIAYYQLHRYKQMSQQILEQIRQTQETGEEEELLKLLKRSTKLDKLIKPLAEKIGSVVY